MHILIRLLVALLLAATAACSRPGPPQSIYLITIDTLRADHLGLYGYPRGTSPFLDSLGERSIVFESAFSSCSHTAPSHASLFTGLQPAQHRLLQNGEPLHPSVLTLAEVLRRQGYRTAGFTTVSFLMGLASGFDELSFETRYHDSTEILGRAREWVAAQEAEQPVFVWIHLFDVHEWNEDRIDENTLEEIRAETRGRKPELENFLQNHHGLSFDGRIPRRKIMRALDRYDGQILSTDRNLADFYAQLETAGRVENSLWIVTSDHGEGLGNHDHLGHGKNIHDEQIRVPLLFHFTDERFTPRRVQGLVPLVDVAPTVAQLTETSFEGQVFSLAGRSYVDLLEDAEGRSSVEKVFTQRRPADELRLGQGWEPGDVFGLQTESLKVIAKTQGQHEVYDLSNDPFELHDLSGDPPPGTEALLREAIRMFQEMTRKGEDELGTSEISPEYVEELKALGYL